jgi:hypothetical protein
MRKIVIAIALAAVLPAILAQSPAPLDSDHDGLSDVLEDALLKQFAPQFMVSTTDCSLRPAKFVPLETKPVVESEDGTIYGQAFSRAGHPDQVELHFYHLWRKDCGDMSHALDAEHVSALISRDESGNWKALYWYAAAHEDTVCDGSQIARASTLDAEDHGPQIWISRGKHGSFLNQALCTRGCGGDVCRNLEPLAVDAIINLGEPSAPAVGTAWVNAPQWPLAAKMRRSDFADTRVERVDQISTATILWANPQKRPYQGAIRGGNGTLDGVAAGAIATDIALTKTDAALDVANTKTGNALSSASKNTGNGLAKSYGGVKKALGVTARKVGKALGGSSGGK